MKAKRVPRLLGAARARQSLIVTGGTPVNTTTLAEVRELILAARQQVAQTVNAGLTILYWQIGACIRKDVLKNKRAEYGGEILQALSAKLVDEFGRGYSPRNLASMVRFPRCSRIRR